MAKQKQTPAQKQAASRQFMMRVIFRQFGLMIVAVVIIVAALAYRFFFPAETPTPDAEPNTPAVESTDTPVEDAAANPTETTDE